MSGRPSSGSPGIDDLVGGLRVGDNVVWLAPRESDTAPFIEAFAQAGLAAHTPSVYISFRLPASEVLTRLGVQATAESLLVLDCYAHGLGQARRSRTRHRTGAAIRTVETPADPEKFYAALRDVEAELGSGALYIFDSLTAMQSLWGPEEALALFLRACPRLYELHTLAYWSLEVQQHDPSFVAAIVRTTQVVLEVGADGRTLTVVKADGRPLRVVGRTATFSVDDSTIAVRSDELHPVRRHVGAVVRRERLARSLSQSEVARRVGISPSALSQVERGLHGLSGDTLVRLWEVLGLPLGLTGQDTPVAYEIARRSARHMASPAPAVGLDTVYQGSFGIEVHLLTFSPGAEGSRPLVATKRRELLIVLAGVLELRLGDSTETLHPGDAIAIATIPVTGWRNPGPVEAKVLWQVL